MRRSIVEDIPFDVALQLWGAAHAGDVAERTAILAEEGYAHVVPMWDDGERALDHFELWYGDEQHSIPLWYVLPYVVLHEMRREMMSV